jgi:hypothetical protein
MKHSWILPVLLVAACGGGKIDSQEEAMTAVEDVINDMAEVLGTVKDKSTAEAARPKLEKLGQRMKEIQEQTEKLPDPDPATQSKYMERMGKAMGKLMEAQMKLPQDPEVHEILDSAMSSVGR